MPRYVGFRHPCGSRIVVPAEFLQNHTQTCVHSHQNKPLVPPGVEGADMGRCAIQGLALVPVAGRWDIGGNSS